jgi:hypothetical protein
MTLTRDRHVLVPLLALFLAWATVSVAEEAEERTTPGPEPPATEEGASDDRAPSLDELLGIEEDEGSRTADEVAGEESQTELQRRLNAEDLGDAFTQAIEKMTISADLLEQRFDTGLGTQRAQEDVLAKLDQLVDIARSMQSSSSSSSNSSGQRQPSPQQQPGRNQSQANQAAGDQRTNASNSQEGDPPARRDGEVNAVFEESRTEWGSLPQRVRDMLLQGRREKFSSLYEQLTREYYQRLAEEGSS